MNVTGSPGERAGRRIGRAWRVFARQNARATRWLIENGVPRIAAVSLIRIVTLGALAVLLYTALWLGIVLVLAVVCAAGAARIREDSEPRFPNDSDATRPPWERGEPTDHRERLFYDPINYNDDPDPRFPDPRTNDK